MEDNTMLTFNESVYFQTEVAAAEEEKKKER